MAWVSIEVGPLLAYQSSMRNLYIIILLLNLVSLNLIAANSKGDFCAIVLAGGHIPQDVSQGSAKEGQGTSDTNIFPEKTGADSAAANPINSISSTSSEATSTTNNNTANTTTSANTTTTNTVSTNGPDITLTRIGTTDILSLQIINEQTNVAMGQIGLLLKERVPFLAEVRKKMDQILGPEGSQSAGAENVGFYNNVFKNIARKLSKSAMNPNQQREAAAQLILKIRQKQSSINWTSKAFFHHSKQLLNLISNANKVLQDHLQQNLEGSYNISENPLEEQATRIKEAILDVMAYNQVGQVQGITHQSILENHASIIEVIQVQLIEEYYDVLTGIAKDAEKFL